MIKPLTTNMDLVAFAIKNRRYWRASDETNHLNGILRHPLLERLNLAPIIAFNDEIATIEKSFFSRHLAATRLARIRRFQKYLMLPEELESLMDKRSIASKNDCKEAISLFDLIKVLNLYSDLVGRKGLNLPWLEFFMRSKPGTYTTTYFDRLLQASALSNWAAFSRSLARNTDLNVDDKSLRDQRKGKNLIPQNRLEAILSELNAQDYDYFAYFVAYCADWHYRQLNPNLKQMVDCVPMQERLDTAVNRWDELNRVFLPKLSPTKHSITNQ